MQIAMRSPHTNLEFQKTFSLPPEEFLINDFTCHLKRKMLTQVYLLLHVCPYCSSALQWASPHSFPNTCGDKSGFSIVKLKSRLQPNCLLRL
jgi:hypothetical protein